MGQFVQAVPAQPGADARNARIVFELEILFKALTQGGVCIQSRFSIRAHAAELERIERAAWSYDVPSVEDRPAVLQFHQRGDNQEHRG